MQCQAPMYFINDEYVGTYSNIDNSDVAIAEMHGGGTGVKVTEGEDDFGADRRANRCSRDPRECCGLTWLAGETASEKGCEWVAMFPEKRCLVKGCMDMGQEGAEGTDCPAEKYTACDGCMTTCAGQMVCGGTGDDGKKPSGDDRK